MEWWTDLDSISTDGDGQTITSIYSRKFRGQWQYAIVTTSDDGEPQRVVILSGGKAKDLE